MNASSEVTKAPKIFAYSTIVPAIWIGAALLLSLAASGKRAGVVGTALILMAAATIIGWLFARRHRRQFSSSEFKRMVAYSLGWVLGLETLVFLAVFFLPDSPSQQFDARALLIVVPVTVVIDALLVWLAFRITAKRVISSSLAKISVDLKQ